MSKKINWNQAWAFSKTNDDHAVWETVDLPHTWNGSDGQDGGNDYYRGTCFYKKILKRGDLPDAKEIYLEFEGTNSSATLYVNRKPVKSHDGGYSIWRANITEYLNDENEILVAVDNSPNDHVYPQKADFTFYGGIYRNVNLICTDTAHFDLGTAGGPGVRITPRIEGTDAVVTVNVFLTGCSAGESLHYSILDEGKQIAEAHTSADAAGIDLTIKNVHLWNGRKDPHLYTMDICLMRDGKIIDERKTDFGCRKFQIDPEKGFILNGTPYPLRGVSRHQDRPGIGNALLPEHHEEDMRLICELGATTVRLAHYQHDQYFYDLCDREGMVVWAEIPYISNHLPNGRENTLCQMKELIIQNYNHPSIAVWGLSNEITMGGASDGSLLENHRALNDLAHQLDPTRLTTQAVLSTCDIHEEYVHIPDVVSYNHYFGWYGGDTSMNGEFMDHFHREYPTKPIGMSEYGCEALNWHSSDPVQGDYTEEYQAHYHEELIRQLYTRPYIWATHVWNMFDFAADARSEGGEDGINHKGLVTFDRKYKKDAFYAYKAWLSDEPFVHLCGKRYVDRVEDLTKITVYSNQPEVELSVNGTLFEKQTSEDHFFYFSVPNTGTAMITVRAGGCTDTGMIRKTDTFNEAYRMQEKGDVINWFEITAPEGYFSINDRLKDIMENPDGARVIGSVLKHLISEAQMSGSMSGGIDLSNRNLMELIGGMSVKRMISLAGAMNMGTVFKKEQVLELNQMLNQIRK